MDKQTNKNFKAINKKRQNKDFEKKHAKEKDSVAAQENLIAGRNAASELLKSGREIDKILVCSRDAKVREIVSLAKERGIPVMDSDSVKMDKLCGSAPHQGVIAFAAVKEYVSIDDILKIAEDRGEKPLIVIADGVEDPHNLGAIIRCAECAGAHGVVIPKRRAVGLTPVVAKSSAGAIEHMAVARVNNIPALIEELKEKGVWTYAAEAGGSPYYETDFDRAAAIVLGSEGNGVSSLAKKRCDFIVSIPMYGRVNSLNVSTAASVILCHAARMQKGAPAK